MTIANCPKGHDQLAEVNVGKAYGHVPGHQYHDVDVVVSKGNGRYRVHIVESWGSAQGYDEEHGRREAIGYGRDLQSAIDDARRECAEGGLMDCEYTSQAIGLARDEAFQAD